MENEEKKILEEKETKEIKKPIESSLSKEEKKLDKEGRDKVRKKINSDRYRNVKSAEIKDIMEFEKTINELFHGIIEENLNDKININELSINHKFDKLIISELKNILLSKGSTRKYISEILYKLLKKYRLKLTGDNEGIKKFNNSRKNIRESDGRDRSMLSKNRFPINTRKGNINKKESQRKKNLARKVERSRLQRERNTRLVKKRTKSVKKKIITRKKRK